MTAAIEVEQLVKRFGQNQAVAGVDLTVPRGSVLGLLGPNGAGKTTVVRILSTLIRPDGGHARVCGFDVVEQPGRVREVIGLTGQYASVDETISGRENLYLIGRLLNLSARAAKARAVELLEQFDLADAAGRLAGRYSGGMRRRLDLAASLVGDPEVLYLDEPTTGLDPRSRNQLWAAVRARVADGTTVLLTTQYMEEAEALADSITVVDRGRVIASGTSAQLRARVGGQVLQVTPTLERDLPRVAAVLAGLGAPSTDAEAGTVSLALAGDRAVTEAIGALGRSGLAVTGIQTHTPSLDEVFLALTGEQVSQPA
ncbi:MAG TPA: ATP-binding cassette domain-containing protein [Pseudonocardiaceae bacterium]|nr:ATP-binding cassette domain-containing protein [Pseudonocardiaceae bacterium]